MKKDYKFRPITVDDYPHLTTWWKLYEKHGIKIPQASRLPNKGLGGFVIEKNGKCIASCFLWFTNSTFGYVDYLIADPNYREEDRDEMMMEFGAYVVDRAVKAGCELVMAITSNKNLLKLLASSPTVGNIKYELKPETYHMVYVYDSNSNVKDE